jgi:hypothetical protein
MRQLKAIVLALILVVLPLTRTVQGQSQISDVDRAARVKSEVTKRLSNKKTRVKIKLHDGGEVKGRLQQATDDRFTLVEDKTGKQVELAYGAVDKVSGRGMSTLTKVGIGAAVAVGVVAIVVIVALKNFDPFSGGITAR